MSNAASTKEARKRKATSRLDESDEVLAKKLKEAQDRRSHVHLTSETRTDMSQASTAPSTQPTTPQASSMSTNTIDNIEIIQPPPQINNVGSEPASDNDDGADQDDQEEEGPEDPQKALGKWTYKSPVYVFYLPPVFKQEDDKCYQVFRCAAKECMTIGGHIVKRNMDTTDATSTSNLKAHALKCFGKDAVKAAMDVKYLKKARDVMKDKVGLRRSGSIVVAFQQASTEKITHSTTPASTLEVHINHVGWMCKSKRPFVIAKDRGYHQNMKTGRPHQYIPSPETISQDVRVVFVEARKHMSRLLKAHDGRFHFATDCWTAPNRRAYMAVTIQFATEGVVKEWLLDIVEVARSHTGVQLATTFADILDAFSICDKVLAVTCDNAYNNNALIERLSEVVPSFGGQGARICCFAHVVNLVVKSILSQFDAPGEDLETEDNGDLQESLIDLAKLADGLIDNMEFELEEVPPEERDADNNDGWVDE
ncbi:hypothetical protein AX14_011894 [Amanita brunnescens Koide BX004]|nr:hypothetical protein AX14_011894 [Amanita brunnescens Koide BX004]